jgi:cytidine deaminase
MLWRELKEFNMCCELPRIFKPALDASQKAEHDQYKIGAALFFKDKLISTGCNNIAKTHPLCSFETYGRPVTTHAEANAIAKARNFLMDLSDSDKKKLIMVTYRKSKDGRPAMAYPCSGCQNLASKFGIGKFAYTTENGYALEMKCE